MSDISENGVSFLLNSDNKTAFSSAGADIWHNRRRYVCPAFLLYSIVTGAERTGGSSDMREEQDEAGASMSVYYPCHRQGTG